MTQNKSELLETFHPHKYTRGTQGCPGHKFCLYKALEGSELAPETGKRDLEDSGGYGPQ